MMLMTDMACTPKLLTVPYHEAMLTVRITLVSTDKSFRPWAEKYAQNEEAFFSDFSKVYAKLLENGVPTEVRFVQHMDVVSLLIRMPAAELEVRPAHSQDNRRTRGLDQCDCHGFHARRQALCAIF